MITVSVIDLVAELEHTATVAQINAAFATAACGPLAGVLAMLIAAPSRSALRPTMLVTHSMISILSSKTIWTEH